MQLPTEVITDFNKYLTESQIYQIDPSGKKQANAKRKYTILDDSENLLIFHDFELAPPSGFFGANYTQWVQFFPN